jgi:hypothetical protein
VNILTDRLPEAIRVNGRVYEINSDFRDCLRIILAFEDNSLTPLEKQMLLMENLFRDVVNSEDYPEAMQQGVRFLDGGGKLEEDAEGDSGQHLRLYSFSRDANLIFAAFQQTHGIDLQNTEYLHWWQFLTLFMDLGESTSFCSLVGLRKRVKTGKATKEERQVAREMGAMFEVPELDTRSLAEKIQDREFVKQVQEARKQKRAAREQKEPSDG